MRHLTLSHFLIASLAIVYLGLFLDVRELEAETQRHLATLYMLNIAEPDAEVGYMDLDHPAPGGWQCLEYNETWHCLHLTPAQFDEMRRDYR